MPEKCFFIDLDGTLLDVSEKFYWTYRHILSNEGLGYLEKDAYWELKRDKTPEKDIQALTNSFLPDFSQRRKAIIETDSYQRYDVLYQGVIEFLDHLKSLGKLVLVSLRHNPEQAIKQLKQHKIYHMFDATLFGEDTGVEKWNIKLKLIQDYFEGQIPLECTFIGDTEIDVNAGKLLGCKTIGVLSGMRNEKLMKSYNPDIIIQGITDFKI